MKQKSLRYIISRQILIVSGILMPVLIIGAIWNDGSELSMKLVMSDLIIVLFSLFTHGIISENEQ